MPKAVIFDLDGTLLHTLPDITAASNHVLAGYDRPPCTETEMRGYVGNGARHQLRCAWKGEVDEDTLSQALERYRVYYPEHMERTVPYDGMRALLGALREKGWRMAVVSNKPQQPTERLCARHFPGLLDCVMGERPTLPKKPAPDMVYAALASLGVRAEDCVFVGDSDVDVNTARNSGLDCLSCTWGYRSVEELRAAGATVLVDSAAELLCRLTGEDGGGLLSLLRRRRSIRRYQSRPVEQEALAALLEAARLCPSSRDLHPVRVLPVTERAVIDALSHCKQHGAEPLKTAPLALVLAAEEEKSDTWLEDSSLVAFTLQLMAQELGLGSCWIQIRLRKDADGGDAERNVARTMGLPAGERCGCILAVGYRAEE